MALLDWLGDVLGGSSGSGMLAQTMPFGNPTSSPGPAQPPMPPVQGLDLPQPPGGGIGSDAVAAPNQPPLPPTGGGIGSDAAAAPGQPPIPPTPPAGAPSGGQPMNIVPPTPPTDISAVNGPGAAALPPPDSGPQAKGIIGRALGLDPNREAQVRGSLGAGLKSVGENWNKPGLAAFAGSAGAGIEGGKKADDDTTKQQDAYLKTKVAATNAGDTHNLNMARTQLALAQAKNAMAGNDKAGVMNSQQQLYLRGQALVNNDPEVKLAKATYDNALKSYDPDSKEVKAAKQAHADLVAAKTKQHMEALGIDPKISTSIAKQPGMSAENPVPKDGLTQEKFNALPPGAYFINPKDGKLLQKKATGGAGPQTQAQPSPAIPTTPPIPPVASTAPAGSGKDDED